MMSGGGAPAGGHAALSTSNHSTQTLKFTAERIAAAQTKNGSVNPIKKTKEREPDSMLQQQAKRERELDQAGDQQANQKTGSNEDGARKEAACWR